MGLDKLPEDVGRSFAPRPPCEVSCSPWNSSCICAYRSCMCRARLLAPKLVAIAGPEDESVSKTMLSLLDNLVSIKNRRTRSVSPVPVPIGYISLSVEDRAITLVWFCERSLSHRNVSRRLAQVFAFSLADAPLPRARASCARCRESSSVGCGPLLACPWRLRASGLRTG